MPVGTNAQRLATLAAFKGRRDDLGTTHHDAGTMRMGDNIADSVTNDFGLIHDTTNALKPRTASERFFGPGNPAWKPVISGFEIQIDDNARGDSSKDFYGISPEPDGKFKNRTGAIYKIPAGDRVWHLNFHEPALQTYNPGPALVPGVWFEYEIGVQADDYRVFLTNLQSGQRTPTTSFQNTDPDRGRTPGCVGIQAYSGSTVARRHIRIKTA